MIISLQFPNLEGLTLDAVLDFFSTQKLNNESKTTMLAYKYTKSKNIKMMNNKVLSLGIILAIISGTNYSVLAEKNIAISSQNIPRSIVDISPRDLVDAGYQGHLVKFNIPSHGKFLTAIQSNKVDSKLLVETAIKSGRLAPDKIKDPTYIKSVKDLLELKLKDN